MHCLDQASIFYQVGDKAQECSSRLFNVVPFDGGIGSAQISPTTHTDTSIRTRRAARSHTTMTQRNVGRRARRLVTSLARPIHSSCFAALTLLVLQPGPNPTHRTRAKRTPRTPTLPPRSAVAMADIQNPSSQHTATLPFLSFLVNHAHILLDKATTVQ